ncbi:hypothetical protein R3P38DRAFT_547866 [Favolaschia claudopus]|uniref:Uncharacterized protein n=1 Tax=Favolaschia claudopus TaxID=2862362 RepID=A0AAW0CK93_9AGAR
MYGFTSSQYLVDVAILLSNLPTRRSPQRPVLAPCLVSTALVCLSFSTSIPPLTPSMAEAAAAFLGAGATVGAAALVGGSGFTGRHENSLREEIQATKKSTADFMENLQRGDVTGEEEIVFWNTRAEAMETERSYSEALDIYKDASWIRNPVNKYRKQTEVRGKKRLTRKYNQSLESLNESMYSGSETSSIAASSGSPPGSNASAESIRDWADDIAENGEVYR